MFISHQRKIEIPKIARVITTYRIRSLFSKPTTDTDMKSLQSIKKRTEKKKSKNKNRIQNRMNNARGIEKIIKSGNHKSNIDDSLRRHCALLMRVTILATRYVHLNKVYANNYSKT